MTERRSIRRFSDRAVARALVADLLRDALWAPSPHNSQPWRFTALFEPGDKSRLAAAMAGQLRADLERDGLPAEEIERQSHRSFMRVSSAPAMVLCSLNWDGLVRYADEKRDTLEWQMAVQSVGAVLQTFFLLAWSRGLGSCWMAAPMYCPDAVRAVLGLAGDVHPQALVLLGYPDLPGRVRPRRPERDVVDIR